MDNGVELMTLAWLSCAVYQDLLFGPGAIFEAMSIKHRKRSEVLNHINKVFAQPVNGGPTSLFEIDQTSMEMHCRDPGTLSFVLDTIQYIARVLQLTLPGQHGRKYDFRIAYDRENGMRLTCVQCQTPTPNKGKKNTLKFPDMFLDSGWCLTSASNFTLELFAVMSCLVANPEHLFAWDKKKGMFAIPAGTFNWRFKSLPFPAPGTAEMLPDTALDRDWETTPT